jgi:transposase
MPPTASWPTGEIRLTFCWPHVLRRFYELAVSGPAPIASEALERIAELYAVEKDIRWPKSRGSPNGQIPESRPLIDVLEPWLRTKLNVSFSHACFFAV